MGENVAEHASLLSINQVLTVNTFAKTGDEVGRLHPV
jgi:hypothetical protein